MPDHKPPRLAGGERETLQALLQYQRDSMVRKVSGVDDDGARRHHVGSGTTLLWLVKHLVAAETRWIQYRFAGEDVRIPDDRVGPHDTMPDAIEAYRATWERTDAVLSATESLDEPCRRPTEERDVNLRWIVMHLLEETARHAGHADILRELVDGHTGR